MTNTTTPKPPSHFSEKAKKVWNSVNADFELQSDAVETLRIALENLDLADSARELLRKQGLVIAGKKHPASDAVKLHDGLFLRAMRQLGLDIVAPNSGAQAGRRS